MSGRKALKYQIADVMRAYKRRPPERLIKTDHVIFIPAQHMVDNTEETDEFIKTAWDINNNKAWGCSVTVEKKTGTLSGVEFIFTIDKNTACYEIADYIEK